MGNDEGEDWQEGSSSMSEGAVEEWRGAERGQRIWLGGRWTLGVDEVAKPNIISQSLRSDPAFQG